MCNPKRIRKQIQKHQETGDSNAPDEERTLEISATRRKLFSIASTSMAKSNSRKYSRLSHAQSAERAASEAVTVKIEADTIRNAAGGR